MRELRRHRVFSLVLFLLCGSLFFRLVAPVRAFDWKRLLRQTARVVGIQALVRTFARPLNDFINTLLFNNKVENRQATKVVPIVSFGERKAVGAAQVSGSEEALKQVRAVVEYDDIFSRGRFKVKALVPGDSADPTRFSRVYGVGVTAVIDVKM